MGESGSWKERRVKKTELRIGSDPRRVVRGLIEFSIFIHYVCAGRMRLGAVAAVLASVLRGLRPPIRPHAHRRRWIANWSYPASANLCLEFLIDIRAISLCTFVYKTCKRRGSARGSVVGTCTCIDEPSSPILNNN
ncbi:hypothetical protein K439DRAFT_144292 [Ramaria rubella]|nr:hypothetical protein K439DRAFT_144292 [Ramaria rubella]